MTDESHRVVRNIVYRSIDGADLCLDLHLPLEGRARPGVILYFHGGGLQEGSRTDYEASRAAALAARGFAVATIQYRFIQDAALPACVEDARAAIDWLKERGKQHQIDPCFIGAWGASAGGYICALLAVGNPEQQRPADVDCAVIWFAAFDLAAMGWASPMEAEVLGISPVEGLLGAPYDASSPIHRSVNPISLANGRSAPMLLVTGDRDKIIEPSQSVRMHDALVRAGASSRLYVIGAAGHEDPAFDAPASIAMVAGHFEEHFRK